MTWKAWLGIFGVFGIGFGAGYFTGMRKMANYAAEKIDSAHEKYIENHSPISADNIIKEQGYAPQDDMSAAKEEMDQYLAGYEHPEDEEESDDISDELSDLINDEDESVELFCDESRWENETEYDCYEYYWYMKDDVVCDEDENRIEDVGDVIGKVTLQTMMDWDVDVIFARNSGRFNEGLYKITRINDSYGRAVLGLSEDYEFYPRGENE